MSLLKSTAYASLAGLVVSGGRFALTVVLARKLTVIDFGQFAYVQWLVDTLYLCLSFGAGAMASRYLAQYATQPALLHTFQRRLSVAYLVVPLLVMAAFQPHSYGRRQYARAMRLRWPQPGLGPTAW